MIRAAAFMTRCHNVSHRLWCTRKEADTIVNTTHGINMYTTTMTMLTNDDDNDDDDEDIDGDYVTSLVSNETNNCLHIGIDSNLQRHRAVFNATARLSCSNVSHEI